MEKQFVSYDYKEIVADSDKVSFYIDAYENFGWEMDRNLSEINGQVYAHVSKVAVRMKRNRKIVNKMELTRLQRNFEACAREIDILEKSKTAKATSYALMIGVLGTAFMAGSVFAVVAQPPMILLCILLAIPAFIGWLFPYFIYKAVLVKENERITPLLEAKYDEIYEICEKGNKLLA